MSHLVSIRFQDGTSEPDIQDVLDRHDMETSSHLVPLNIVTAHPRQPVDLDELVVALNEESVVRYAERMGDPEPAALPDDPLFNAIDQWWLFNVRVNEAFDAGFIGDSSVIIAILDSGVDPNHPDLQNKLATRINFTSDPPGLDNWHGTHVAGIAAAQTNNGVGVAGTGYNCRYHDVKMVGTDGDYIGAITWAADSTAQVINMSWTVGPTQALEDAINYAAGQGKVLVAAAGNGDPGVDVPAYPAAYAQVIAVAATDSANAMWTDSNYGPWVDIAAPGVGIQSTTDGGGYGGFSGTSMASPLVAGVAGLIIAAGITDRVSIRNLLVSTAVGDYPVRSAKLDAKAALDLATTVHFRPGLCSEAVDFVITGLAQKYNLPRWWLYVMAHRESSFNPSAFNDTNGGEGLTQLTQVKHNGKPYPMNLQQPDDTHQQWIWDMGKDQFGNWVDMNNVSVMLTGFDAFENMNRFCTVHGIPGFGLMKQFYPSVSDNNDLLRRSAYHYNRGIFAGFDPNHAYFDLYDQYVTDYRASVEADDGVWNGQPDYESAPPPMSQDVAWTFAQVYGTRMYGSQVVVGTPPPAVSITSDTFDITAPITPPPSPHFPSIESPEVLIRILDSSGTSGALPVLAEVREYVSAVWRRTYWNGSRFHLMVPARIKGEPNPVIPLLAKHNYVRMYLIQPGDSVHENLGMGGEFQGVIERSAGAGAENAWIVSGQNILGKRLVIPKRIDFQFREEYDTGTGNAESVMYGFVSRHAVFPVDELRIIPRLTLGVDRNRPGDVTPDESTGDVTITEPRRYDNLQDVLAEIGQKSNLGWQTVPVSNGFRFEVYQGVDRSTNPDRPVDPATGAQADPVVFNLEMLNISDMAYERSSLPSTLVYVAGQGEGADRIQLAVGHPDYVAPGVFPARMDRTEKFIDARDVSTLRGLFLRGQAKLRELGPEERLEGTILHASAYRYRTHWNVGDIVTIENEEWDVQVHLRILEVEVIFERMRNPEIRVVFGSPIANRFSEVERGVRQMNTALRI